MNRCTDILAMNLGMKSVPSRKPRNVQRYMENITASYIIQKVMQTVITCDRYLYFVT